MPVGVGPSRRWGRGVAALGLPAYAVGKAVHEIFEIANTTHAGSAADPTDDPEDPFCRSTKRLSYSNICVAVNDIVAAACGGHNDYSGNEVTAINLMADTPAWRLCRARTASFTNDADTNTADDTPTSRHTYNSTQYSSTLGRLMLHATRAWYSNAGGSGKSFGFNLATGNWDASSTYGTSNRSASCRDSSDNCWAISNESGHRLYKWIPATNTWTETLSAGSGPGNYLAHDSVNDRLLAVTWGNGDGGGSGTVASIYTSDGTVKTDLTITGPGLSAFEAEAPAISSLIFDPNGERFLHLTAGSSTIFEMTISGTTLTVAVLATTGEVLPPSQYTAGRMAYFPALKAVVFNPAGHLNLYAMRLA